MNNLLAHSRILIVAAALYQTAGCAPVAPHLDSNFGKSVNALKALQMVNPQASANTANPDMDGRAAAAAVGQYQKSFSTPVPHTNVFTIGVGSSAQ